jgi:hypothetical protein
LGQEWCKKLGQQKKGRSPFIAAFWIWCIQLEIWINFRMFRSYPFHSRSMRNIKSSFRSWWKVEFQNPVKENDHRAEGWEWFPPSEDLTEEIIQIMHSLPTTQTRIWAKVVWTLLEVGITRRELVCSRWTIESQSCLTVRMIQT